MKRIAKVAVLFLVVVTMFQLKTVPTEAKDLKVKVLKVQKNKKAVTVKVRIGNKAKRVMEFGNKFELYKKQDGKWEKIELKKGASAGGGSHFVWANGSVEKEYVISRKKVKVPLKKGTYQIRFEYTTSRVQIGKIQFRL